MLQLDDNGRARRAHESADEQKFADMLKCAQEQKACKTKLRSSLSTGSYKAQVKARGSEAFSSRRAGGAG